jgi:hypothetical protein
MPVEEDATMKRALLGVLAAAGIGCAHAQAPAASPRAERIVVTGSHIPQRIDLASSQPQTVAPVRIYSRQQIDNTGRQTDLSAALRDLDPSVTFR